ncbi:MAG: tetratricopeptide repeat protein [Spirochaetales bacterium]|nr:tetratricopeptide repeat protein [Spirochaetales bacterium]
MSDHSRDRSSFSDRLNVFLSHHRTTLLVLSVIVIVGIVATVVIAQLSNNRAERGALAAEQIEELWGEWQASRPSSEEEEISPETAALEESLRAAIAGTIEELPRRYGALRGRFVLGELEWELGNFDAARGAFLAVAEEHPDSHLAAIALFSAAAAAENAGDPDAATTIYGRIVAGEGDPNAEVAHALFNLGRIAEAQGDADLALDYYNRLIDEHGGSTWTNLGRNRIIWLTSRGVGSGE